LAVINQEVQKLFTLLWAQNLTVSTC